jgi:hypothetical protein
MARNQKDKKINNGRQNNTQTNRQYNGQETLFFSWPFYFFFVCVLLCRLLFFFYLFVSWPLYCLFVCVLLCRPLFIFLTFCFLAIILSVCLCIIVSTVVYLFVFLFLGHYIVCLSVYYCVDRCLSFCPFVSWPLYCLFVYNGQETKRQKDKQRSTQ